MTEPRSGNIDSWHQGQFVISADPEKTDLTLVTDYLATSYWAKHLPRDQISASIKAGPVYNLIDEQSGQQVGFARVISDQIRFAYICDVFVLDSHQGRGLGIWLIETVMADPRFERVRHWVLATADAQAFYQKLGFEEAMPGRYMVRKI